MKTIRNHGSIIAKPQYTGKSLEETIRVALATNAPLDGKAPLIYTPAKEGVMPQYNIRTDKQDLALEANDKFQASEQMKGFIAQVETDKEGFDGKQKVEQPKTE